MPIKGKTGYMSSPLAALRIKTFQIVQASVTSHLFCISRERLDVIFEVVRCAESSAGARPKGPCCAPLEASPHRTTLRRRGGAPGTRRGERGALSSCSTSLRKRRAITETHEPGERVARSSGSRIPKIRSPNRKPSCTRCSDCSCRAYATNSSRTPHC